MGLGICPGRIVHESYLLGVVGVYVSLLEIAAKAVVKQVTACANNANN